MPNNWSRFYYPFSTLQSFVRYPLSIVLLMFLFAFRFPLSASADYSSAYQDYVYNYQLYRTAYNEFQVAKSTFQTYKTLTAQADAVIKFREVIKARDQVVFVYYDLLQEKMNNTTGISDDAKTTLANIKKSERDWLTTHQKRIDAASSLDDLNAASSEFESRYPQMDLETKQTIGTILIAKETTLSNRQGSLISDLTTKLAAIRADGQDTSFFDRGLINTKNKLDLNLEKIKQAAAVFNTSSRDTIDLFAGQQKLTEANQYLREANTFVLELIKAITG